MGFWPPEKKEKKQQISSDSVSCAVPLRARLTDYLSGIFPIWHENNLLWALQFHASFVDPDQTNLESHSSIGQTKWNKLSEMLPIFSIFLSVLVQTVYEYYTEIG